MSKLVVRWWKGQAAYEAHGDRIEVRKDGTVEVYSRAAAPPGNRRGFGTAQIAPEDHDFRIIIEEV